MALVASPMPSLSAYTDSLRTPFRGDDDFLVDRLVASCATAFIRAPLSSYGRELQPYSFDDTPLVQKAHPVASTKRVSAAAKGVNMQQKKVKGSTPAAGTKRGSSSASMPASPPKAQVDQKRTKPASKAPVVATKSVRAELTPIKWAGPGFCNSPLPEALPMPTFGLRRDEAADAAAAGTSPTHANIQATNDLKRHLNLII